MTPARALLLTDVVDSTVLAEQLGDAAAAALWAAHDRAARDLLRSWGGREIDKTDGMLLLFDGAAAAVGFALAYHAALAALPVPLKARAGLHVGPVILRANPPEDVALGAKPLEVEGIAKPVAARVMSLALGGQTLLTAEARAALGATALRVQSHGFWRIKGVAEPIELFEAGGADAPFTPPGDSAKVYRVVRRDGLWLPLREVPHSLPAERDAFVGRDQALAELARRFDRGARLVSLLGIGGTGKTRLATRFAWAWLGDFPGGAWFCDLAAARSVDGIVQAVAQGLRVPLGADDPTQQLGHAIAGRGACLVILDNFEQVARHAEETLGRWLDRAPDARFLVTTREVLGLPGEEAQALPPLGEADATTLFLRRAVAAGLDPRGGDDDCAAAAQLVRLLDGLPLAIELAAARVRVMPPRTLLARMDQRFRLLAAGGGRQDRQATLRTTFDWSWDLLSDAEKAALAQLSVFEGGFSLESAEQVLDLGACGDGHWAPDLLQSLVDKSFVRRLDGGRFDLLSSVQEYAGEHLCTAQRFPGSGAAALQAARQRHARHFAQRAALPPEGDHGADLDNLVAACRRALQWGDAATAACALDGAWSVFNVRGPFAAGLELALEVCRMPVADAAAHARAALVAGCALDVSGRADEAQPQLLAALQLARAAGEPVLEARVLMALGVTEANRGRRAEAGERHAAALALARPLGLHAVACGALNGLGSACIDLGRTAEARGYYLEALQVARAAGERRWEGWLLGNLGGLDFDEGSLDKAQQHIEAALQIARELGDRKGEGNMLCNLAALHEVRERLPQALQASHEALQVARAIGHVRLEAVVQCNLGLVALDQHQWDRARAHLEAAVALARRLCDRRREGQFLGYLGRLHARERRFDDGRACLRAGQALLEEAQDRPSLGLLACQWAELEALAGDRDAAARALDTALDIQAALGAGPDSELGSNLSSASRLLEQLDPLPAAATSGSG
jgi:predicted ATPase/class 3 adenylate cyclase